jgi:hypothetical protein
MFGRYEKYRVRLVLLVIAICAYEIVYSRGSRIMAFLVIGAYIGLYTLQVRAISIQANLGRARVARDWFRFD